MINIISSCTNSKKQIPSEIFTIANFDTDMYLCDVINIWSQNIKTKKAPVYTAAKLYKGSAWQATLNTKTILSSKFNTNLYVASAGYGLIHSETKICSYNSTFTSSTPNSINKFIIDSGKNANVEWWNSINKFELSSFQKGSYFFIILPHEYLSAAQDTIKFLIEKFDKNVFIFIANKNATPTFMKNHVIKFDSRFNNFQNGILSNILQRAVLWLSNEIIEKDIPLNHQVLQEHIETKMGIYEVFKMPIRKKLTDKETRIKIKNMILDNNITSATRGLKNLRNSGFACEQKRFGKIFREVQSELT